MVALHTIQSSHERRAANSGRSFGGASGGGRHRTHKRRSSGATPRHLPQTSASVLALAARSNAFSAFSEPHGGSDLKGGSNDPTTFRHRHLSHAIAIAGLRLTPSPDMVAGSG